MNHTVVRTILRVIGPFLLYTNLVRLLHFQTVSHQPWLRVHVGEKHRTLIQCTHPPPSPSVITLISISLFVLVSLLTVILCSVRVCECVQCIRNGSSPKYSRYLEFYCVAFSEGPIPIPNTLDSSGFEVKTVLDLFETSLFICT